MKDEKLKKESSNIKVNISLSLLSLNDLVKKLNYKLAGISIISQLKLKHVCLIVGRIRLKQFLN